MSRLIRFEDAYGMADLVCLVQDIPLINLQSNTGTTSLTGINQIHYCKEKDIYYECGISFPTLLIPSNNLLAAIKKYNIDEIIFVYDMDSPEGGQSILSSSTLKKKLDELYVQLDNSVKIRLLPIVWAAETFALYILACDYDAKKATEIVQEPTKLIHTKNIARFHSKIIERYLEYYKIQARSKHLREYIHNKEEAIRALNLARNKFKDSINAKAINWILENDDSYLFNINEAIQHQEEVNIFYNNNQPKPKEKFNVMGKLLDMTKKCW